jgi:uncharacterized membrane protein
LTTGPFPIFLKLFQFHAFVAPLRVSPGSRARNTRTCFSALKAKGVPMTVQTSQSGLGENVAGGLAYFTIIPAIVFLIIEPYSRNQFVRFQCWQSIFLNIAAIVIDVALIILGRFPFIGWSVIFIMPLVGIVFFVVWIIVLINAFNGKRFKVPIVGDLAEKQANS